MSPCIYLFRDCWFIVLQRYIWQVVKLNKQWKHRRNSSKLGAYDGVDCTAKAPNSLQVIYVCEGILIKEEPLTVCYGRAVLVVWLVNYDYVPFSTPKGITDVRLLRLSVAMNDPGRGICIAKKEQRLVSMMTYSLCWHSLMNFTDYRKNHPTDCKKYI
jgi:hypothetical protein